MQFLKGFCTLLACWPFLPASAVVLSPPAPRQLSPAPDHLLDRRQVRRPYSGGAGPGGPRGWPLRIPNTKFADPGLKQNFINTYNVWFFRQRNGSSVQWANAIGEEPDYLTKKGLDVAPRMPLEVDRTLKPERVVDKINSLGAAMDEEASTSLKQEYTRLLTLFASNPPNPTLRALFNTPTLSHGTDTLTASLKDYGLTHTPAVHSFGTFDFSTVSFAEARALHDYLGDIEQPYARAVDALNNALQMEGVHGVVRGVLADALRADFWGADMLLQGKLENGTGFGRPFFGFEE